MLKMGFCIVILANILFAIPLFAQGSDTATKVTTITNSSIIDCVTTGQDLWVLQSDGILLKFNGENYENKNSVQFPRKIVAIGNREETIYTATEDGIIRTIGPRGDTNIIWQTGQVVRYFTFNSKGECFMITDKGIIYDPQKKQGFENWNAYPNPLAHQGELSSFFMDKQDNLWVGYDGGEWGGDLMVFSTSRSKFIDGKKKKWEMLMLNPVKSIFGIDSALYISTEINHSTLRSTVMQIADPFHIVFRSGRMPFEKMAQDQNVYEGKGLHIGPATYNTIDSSIYFYCQFGVFKGNVHNDLSKIENWRLVLNSQFLQSYRVDPMRTHWLEVSKMFFSGNKLYILSPENGIHTWDGKKSTLLKTTYKRWN